MTSTTIPGWQSWSDTRSPHRRTPVRYRSPHSDNFPHIPASGPSPKPPVTGWCSWHFFGPRIDSSIIMHQARFLSALRPRLPLQYILIDDGWTTWGDWDTPHPQRFPESLPVVVKQLRGLGFKSGLWIAPFLAKKNSRLFRNHPDWFIKDKNGAFVEGTKISLLDGLIPNPRYILNPSLPQVRAYLDSIFDLIASWGFELVKLDFLYAPHFNPLHSTPRIPDFHLRKFLTRLRRRHPNLYTIACGVPLAPAAGVVDAVRISEDINIPHLKYLWPLNSFIHSARLSQLQANLAARKSSSHLWNLDPDAFITHPAFGISAGQIKKLRDVILSAPGLRFLGDDLTSLSPRHIHTHIRPIFSRPRHLQ